MKKALILMGLLSMAVLTACQASLETTEKAFQTNDEVISLSALATTSLIPTLSNQTLASQHETVLLSSDANEAELETDDDPVIENIEPYIELVEQLLGSTNGLNVMAEASELEGYEQKMTFQTSGMAGETSTYVIHYNMTLEEEEDDESEFSLEGVMIVDGLTYTLVGEREVEDGEEEIEFIAYLDDQNYVVSEYKVESEEVEFEIQVVVNGVTVSETKVEIKEEDLETKVELEFIDGVNSGVYEFKFETEDGQSVLKIEFDTNIDGVEASGEMTVSVHVDDLTGETTYQVIVNPEDDDAYEKSIDRDIDDDDDEDDEEDDDEEDDEDDEDVIE
ncbi:MAG: hypothetical protein K9K93_06890 [Acholeplasmataceae bacterium]|nr:hypothetical protein [Acholeplasmataceae bacterium]